MQWMAVCKTPSRGGGVLDYTEQWASCIVSASIVGVVGI